MRIRSVWFWLRQIRFSENLQLYLFQTTAQEKVVFRGALKRSITMQNQNQLIHRTTAPAKDKGKMNMSGIIKRTISTGVLAMALSAITATDVHAQDIQAMAESPAFENAAAGAWESVFFDDCTGDYRDQWFLDGEVATVTNTPDGMRLTSGHEAGNDAHHMVLWTREPFKGDVKIEYDYRRLDSQPQGVNIIYIQATGSGDGPYVPDIAEWAGLRKVAAMGEYFNHMNTYHISYAVGMPGSNYIRARRYIPLPEGQGLRGTEIMPDYGPTGFFGPGVGYGITIIKRDQELFMRVTEKNSGRTAHYHWNNNTHPPVTEGRIGLRQMATKSALYANFRVSVPQ
jgi:hypothetical protein